MAEFPRIERRAECDRGRPRGTRFAPAEFPPFGGILSDRCHNLPYARSWGALSRYCAAGKLSVVQEVTMKASILGAGAVGSMLGGLIKCYQPQIEMQFIARGSHGE